MATKFEKMSRQHVNHVDIVRFAQEKVNLPKDKANECRAISATLEGSRQGLWVRLLRLEPQALSKK